MLHPVIDHLPIALQTLTFSGIATVLEYFTSLSLEKIASSKIWDYSNNFMNINGRICLRFSCYWALLSYVVTQYVHPQVIKWGMRIPDDLHIPLLAVFIIYFSIDLFYSAKLYRKFSAVLTSIKEKSLHRTSPAIIRRIQNSPQYKIPRKLLRPLNVFPHLRIEFFTRLNNLPVKSRLRVIDELHHNLQKAEYSQEFDRICSPIINHPEYQKLKELKHHDKDIYSHNLEIAWLSFLLSKRLHLRSEQIVRGALLHDFFFYDWRTEKTDGKILPHGFTHPSVSKENAERIFGPLTPLEKDIIIKHMWPLTIIPPRYLESFIVSFIDKFTATKEMFHLINANNRVI
jgi:uncharacterized protein